MQRLDAILTHIPTAGGSESVHSADLFAQVQDHFGDHVARWAVHVAERATHEIYQDVPANKMYMVADRIRATNESISLYLLRFLRADTGYSTPRVSKPQRDSIVTAVREGFQESRQVASLRLLERHWKQAFVELIVRNFPVDETLRLLHDLDAEVSKYFDILVDQHVRMHAEEHQRLIEKRLVGQRQLVQRVISGLPVDDATFVDVMGIPASVTHYGFFVASAAAAGRRAPALDFRRFRAAFEEHFHDMTVAVIADTDVSWIFASGDPLTPEDVAARVQRVLEDVPGALVSLGSPGRGREGLRLAHLTARSAHHLNTTSPSAGPIVSFPEDGLLALAVADPDLARRFMVAEVGPLLSDAPFNDDLRATLLCLLRHNGSLVRAAEELFVHRNTITHRLKRLEEMLGRDPLSRPVETSVALMLADHLPAA